MAPPFNTGHPFANSNTLQVAWFGYITTTVPALSEIQYKQDTGSGWSANPINLSNTRYDSVNVALASAGANIYLVWNDKQTGNAEIFFKRSTDNGSTWGVSPAATPTPTSTSTPGPTRTPTFTPTPTLVTPTYTPTPTAAGGSVSNVTKYYYFGSVRVAMRTSAGITYLFGDHLGSTSAAIDPNGQLTKQGYFAFGGVRYNVGALPTDYTFTGQKSDDSDGLIFYNAR